MNEKKDIIIRLEENRLEEIINSLRDANFEEKDPEKRIKAEGLYITCFNYVGNRYDEDIKKLDKIGIGYEKVHDVKSYGHKNDSPR